MKPGPKPRPPEARAGRERVEATAPALTDSDPVCPDHLDAEGKAKFAELVELLRGMGTLSRGDRDTIALFAETHSRYLATLALIKTLKPAAMMTPKGGRMMGMRTALVRDLHRLGAELGLTPSARSRVASPVQRKSRLAKFRESRPGATG